MKPTKLTNSFKSYIKFPIILIVFKVLLFDLLNADNVIILLCESFKYPKFSISSKVFIFINLFFNFLFFSFLFFDLFLWSNIDDGFFI